MSGEKEVPNEKRSGDKLPMKKFESSKGSKFGLETIWAEGAKMRTISKTQMSLQLAQSAWRSFSASPLTALLTLLTVSIVLSLFGAFVMVVQNISSGVTSSNTNVSLRLFLVDGVSSVDVDAARHEIEAMPSVKAVRVISKTDALEEFRQALGDDAALLNGLDGENPLPASIEITFSSSEDLASRVDAIAERYKTSPLVAEVQYSRSLVGQFAELLHVIRIGGGVAVLLLLAGTAFVITITIRLAFYAHRHEIHIMRLVGANTLFIRAPFMIEGFFEGLAGSAVGLVTLILLYNALSGALLRSELARTFEFNLRFLSSGWIAVLMILGPVLGLCGSFLAVRRFGED